jgi:hypothetical protein
VGRSGERARLSGCRVDGLILADPVDPTGEI